MEPMDGKTVLITGATSGIGKATALGLATMGARIAITGRDRARTEDAAREVRTAGGGHVDLFVADLSSQADVRRLSTEVLDRLPRIDVLVNNAGGSWDHPARHRRRARAHLRGQPPRAVPADVSAPRPTHGRAARPEWSRCRPGRTRPGASTSTTSRASGPGPASGHTVNRSSPTSCSPMSSPGRLRATAVTANALHPGVVRTSFGASDPGLIQRLLVPFVRPFMLTPVKGAATSIHLASSPDLAGRTGGYLLRQQAQAVLDREL